MQTRVLNGRYILEAQLGQGGMATVYRGYDSRLGRAVAIKLLHGHYAADDEFLQRFTHEAMSAATLSAHPNIVDVYDVGEEGDMHYIVMELIEGYDLKVMIEQEAPLPTEQALSIAAQVADGLEYAHRQGLVHRDIKPQNILLSTDGQVHIADFGIAKSHLSTAVTHTGITFGTADYISPEQAQGWDASPQSDIYSLGIVLYEMLTGQLPFSGTSPMAVALQHIQHQPVPPRQINPAIPATVEALVLRAIAKDPQERPTSASIFAQELRALASGRVHQPLAEPSGYSQPQPRYDTHNWGTQPAQRGPIAQPAQPRRQAQRTSYAAPPPRVVPPQESRGSSFGTVLLSLLLVTGILVLAFLLIGLRNPDRLPFGISNFFAPDQVIEAPPVEVPQLVGLPEAEAVALLNARGLRRRVDPNNPSLAPQHSTEYPRGTIMLQAPNPGTPVPAGSEVTIIVSLGPE